jgi:hypothetical protein
VPTTDERNPVSDRIGVIEADHYREEEARLREDPILLAMHAEIPADVDRDSWEFISGASDEFHRRGGKADSIGGPARALSALKALADSSAVPK